MTERRTLFDHLVSQHEQELLRLGRGLLGSWQDAQDVTQCTLLKLWQRLPQLNKEEDLLPWLRRVQVNHCLSELRKRRLRCFLGLESVADQCVPESGVSHIDKLLRCAESLGHRQRVVWVLCDLEGWSASHVAELLGIRASTIRVHLLQARRRLRTLLEEEDQ